MIARYWFALLIVLIVIRAWRMTIVDNRRARTLRSLASSTGQLGELVVMKGSGKARKGMRYAILQEGMLGSSARADIRIRSQGVHGRHAYFQMRPDGLLLTAIGSAELAFAEGDGGKKLLASDGDNIVVGDVTLLCVLFDGQTDQVHQQVSAPKRDAAPQPYDELDDYYNRKESRTKRPEQSALDVADMMDDPFMLNKEDTWQEQKPTRKRSRRR